MFRRDPLLRAAIQPSELIRWRFLKMTLSEQYRRNPDGFRTNFGKNLAKIALAGPLRSRPERHCELRETFRHARVTFALKSAHFRQRGRHPAYSHLRALAGTGTLSAGRSFRSFYFRMQLHAPGSD